MKGNISFTVTLDMAWAVSFIANLLKKGAFTMFQICAACVDALARGQVVIVLVSLQAIFLYYKRYCFTVESVRGFDSPSPHY